MDNMLDCIRALPCKHVLLVLDCCFGGAIRWASSSRAISGFDVEERLPRQHYQYFTKKVSRQILTSTAPDQMALDFIGRGEIAEHSPFAKCLLDGLSGDADTTQDKVILLSELYSYLQQRLPPITEGRQNVGIVTLPEHQNGEFLFPLDGFDVNDLPEKEFDNPYKGLSAYEPADYKLYFGRSAVIFGKKRQNGNDEDDKGLLEKVKNNQLTVVVGASGTGKSSLVKAGIVPKLAENPIAIITPGRNPMAEMGRIGNARCLVLDQFEQLVTQSEKAEVSEFWNALRNYLGNGGKVIVTVRIDFEKQLEIPLDLQSKWEAGRFLVPPFSPEELREIIITPALRMGRFFEPASMVDKIVQEVVHFPGSLPLLSFTMQQLFEKCRENLYRNITEQDYADLKGVTGALQSSADRVLNSLDEQEKATMRHLMLRMVSLSGGETAGKRVLKPELVFDDPAENARIEKVMGKLDAERLVHAGKDSEGKEFYEPSHDALVRTWKQVQDWIKEYTTDNVLLHARLQAAASEYAAKGNSWQQLWHFNPNRSLVLKTPQNGAAPIALNKDERHFIRRSRWVNQIIWGGTAAFIFMVVIVLSVAAIYAKNQQERAEKGQNEAATQRDIAIKNLTQSYEAERKRHNQEIPVLKQEAIVFENAFECKMAKGRYQQIKDAMYIIDSLAQQIKKKQFETDTTGTTFHS